MSAFFAAAAFFATRAFRSAAFLSAAFFAAARLAASALAAWAFFAACAFFAAWAFFAAAERADAVEARDDRDAVRPFGFDRRAVARAAVRRVACREAALRPVPDDDERVDAVFAARRGWARFAVVRPRAARLVPADRAGVMRPPRVAPVTLARAAEHPSSQVRPSYSS
jgi:hypothetical protein